MAVTASIKVGEIWKLGSLPNSPFGVNHKELGDLFDSWSDLNGLHVKVEDTDATSPSGFDNLIKFSFLGRDEGVKLFISPCYFRERVEANKKKVYTFCRPSVGICAVCKAEADLGMLQQGKKYNQWLRIWQ